MSRPFRGLRRTEPRPVYDAVVIGAGVGGLVCANLLAREGLRVLLLEQHYMTGGYCSTFRRAHYTFDAATHFYPLLGNRETLTGKLLADLGVTTRWVQMDPVDTFHLPDGSRFQVPPDFPTYLRRLKALFPHESQALDAFFADVRKAYYQGLLAYFRGHRTADLAAWEGLTVKEILDRHFRDPKLKLLLTADCAHWGSPPSRTSFVFDSMLRLSYFLGNYYPVGGSQAFADELARCFEDRGGHILMSTRARRIQVEGGRVTGVEMETLRGPLRGRRQVATGVVISNADLLQTLESLVGAQHLDPGYLDSVRRLRPSYPCFLTHIGLQDVAAEDLAERQGYYWNDWDGDGVGRESLCCKIFVPTLYEPRMAPPGGQIVILQKVLEMDYDGVQDWPAHKAQVESYLLQHLARVLPGVEQKIVVKLSASARTAYHFTLNRWGSMLGWEMSPGQLGDERPGIVSPIAGLYFVGHWTRPGGGVTPVIISALQVAEMVKNGAGRPGSLDLAGRSGTGWPGLAPAGGEQGPLAASPVTGPGWGSAPEEPRHG